MSLLNIPTTQTATGDVKKIFDEIEEAFGSVPNGIRLWSANPQALEMQWHQIKQTLSKDQEHQKLQTIIRYLVSEANDCAYCVGFNGGMLINYYGFSQDLLQEIKTSPEKAPLDAKNKALLLFAMSSLKNPHAITQEDVDALKDQGISEIEIFDIVHSASHMLVVNTLFETFKVEED